MNQQSATSSAGERIHSLQALRFFAAAMVVTLHAQQGSRLLHGELFGGALQIFGSFGVDIFFVLSGYIISRTAIGMRPGAFFARRLVRLVPMYWLATLAFLPTLPPALIADPGHGIATLTFYLGAGVPWLGIGWTLCFEMLFYAATAVVLIRPRLLLAPMLLLFALCLLARPAFGGPFAFFGNPLILEFLLGVLLTRVRPPTRMQAIIAFEVALLLLLLAARGWSDSMNDLARLVSGETSLTRVMKFGLPAAVIVWATLGVRLEAGKLTFLGGASYVLYLIHPHVVAILLLGPGLPEWAFVLAALAVAIAASAVIHAAIERPLTGMLNARLGLKRGSRTRDAEPARIGALAIP